MYLALRVPTCGSAPRLRYTDAADPYDDRSQRRDPARHPGARRRQQRPLSPGVSPTATVTGWTSCGCSAIGRCRALPRARGAGRGWSTTASGCARARRARRRAGHGETRWGRITASDADGTPLALVCRRTRARSIWACSDWSTAAMRAAAALQSAGAAHRLPVKGSSWGDSAGHIGWTLTGNAMPLRSVYQIRGPMRIRTPISSAPASRRRTCFAVQLDDCALFLQRWQPLLLHCSIRRLRRSPVARPAARHRHLERERGVDAVDYRVKSAFRQQVIDATLASSWRWRSGATPTSCLPLGAGLRSAVWDPAADPPRPTFDPLPTGTRCCAAARRVPPRNWRRSLATWRRGAGASAQHGCDPPPAVALPAGSAGAHWTCLPGLCRATTVILRRRPEFGASGASPSCRGTRTGPTS